MKTTFSRLFSMIAVLLILCLLTTGIAFRMLMMSWIESENRRSLSADAAALVDLAKAYDAAGELEDSWDFQIGLSLFSEVGEVNALICDENGEVCICSCDQPFCEHVGKQLDESLRREMLRDEVYYEKKASLPDIYSEKRFLAGQAIISDATDELLGFVVVTSPLDQTQDYIFRSSTFFVYTAIAAMILALVAATFLSRSLVRPLGQMADIARRFGYGETNLRAAQTKKNTREINDLALAFNTMADSLEQSEQRRQEFIANVSHELKTPMTTIGGYVDGILDGTIPPQVQKHYLQIVSGEVRRLSRLVRSMLDLSRFQAQGIDESRKTRFDLGEAMSDVLITFEQKINTRHLQVNVELPEKPLWTKADRDAITQVLYNLIDNAIKFCPNGGNLGLLLEQDGQKARICVRNTGPTIAPEELPLLFERFHKADKSRSADREGWGLGLYIAKTIVGVHGGEIWATSENGVTQFFFTLPVVR